MRKFYLLLTLVTGFIFQNIKAQDVAGFNFTIGANNLVSFTNTSTINGPGERKAYWYFGDGSQQTTPVLANTQHQYLNAGVYTACLKIYRATNSSGTDTVLTTHICKTITIPYPVDKCAIKFTDNNTTVSSLTKLFVAQLEHNNNKRPEKICWSFGDGKDTCIEYNPGTSHNYAVYHTYAQPGNYNVCVKVRYEGGCEAEYCRTVTVGNPGGVIDSCKADFSVERLNSSPLSRQFKALPSHSQNKKPARICWILGDGKDTCISYPSTYDGPYTVNHTYAHPGNYEACVKIFYNGGCEAKKCKPVSIPPVEECKADFNVADVASNILTKHFKAITGHSLNKKPVRICWYFGDGKDTCIQYPANYTGSYTVTHTYASRGRYEACVKILYDGGCEAKKCNAINIPEPTNEMCKADFSVDQFVAHPLTRQFKALPWHWLQKKPVKICWTFGDGKDTCIQYPSNYAGPYTVNHTYANQGKYEVCVKIFYEGNCEAKKCKVIEVVLPGVELCKADFSVENFVAHPLTRQFKALPSHLLQKRPVKICWDFGDGKDTCISYPSLTNNDYTVKHTYAQRGEYNVCVKIFYEGGCEAKKCKPVIINHPPVDTCRLKIFQVPTNSNTLERIFYATPNPDLRVEKICWSFGDGTDTCINLPNPVATTALTIRHRFPGPGVYRVCAKVLYANGCVGYDCMEVVIRSNSNLCGGYMTDSLIAPKKVLFRGYSIMDPNDEVVGWRWTFGDGNSGVGKEIRHEYRYAGKYEVCLYIKTRLGCETRICKTIVVRGDNNVAQLHLSPNPVTSILHAVFQSHFQEQVLISIYNANGLVVKTYTKNATLGVNNWDFNVSTLPAGMYSVIVSSPHQLANALFFKQ